MVWSLKSICPPPGKLTYSLKEVAHAQDEDEERWDVAQDTVVGDPYEDYQSVATHGQYRHYPEIKTL